MAVPSSYGVTVKVNNVDITSSIAYDTMDFTDNRHEVSYFRFTSRNPQGVTPDRNHSVTITADDLAGTPVVFSGYIVELEEKKSNNGITLIYEIEAADQKMRLQKSIVEVDNLSGSDTDILAGLLSNSYPDLSDVFSFSNDVTSFMPDLSLDVGNNDLLSALGDLADIAGAAMRFETNGASAADTITFNSASDGINNYLGSESPRVRPYVNGGNTVNVARSTSLGNPNHAWIWQPSTGTFLTNQGIYVYGRLLSSGTNILNNITFDYYVSADIASTLAIHIDVTGTGASGIFTSLGASAGWNTFNANTEDPSYFPKTATYYSSNSDVSIAMRLGATYDAATDNIDMRIDNIAYSFDTSISSGGGKTSLVWDSEPDATDFDFNIDSSDEFGFDFDLSLGDIDDFNSITIVGGHEDFEIDWTYESDGELNHFGLELPISEITVYKNTGSDGSPTWTEQDDGVWGTDLLTSEGGTKDVLYDKDNHWLLFDTNPSNLAKSIRVTGKIKRPIRVRVEEVADGDPTFATIHRNDKITSVGDAVAIGEAKLAERNAVRRMSFKTYEPGLKVGQAIDIVDSNRGLSETLTINRIHTKWIGGATALFTIECGEDQYDSASGLIADNDKRSRQNSFPPVTNTQTVVYVTDDSGTQMTDNSGRKLYYYTES